MWVKSEAKRWGSCRALGERAPEIYNWDSGVGVGCWAVSWLWSKNTTGAPSSGTGWVCWWSSLSTNHWTLAGSGFAFFFSMIFRLKRNPTILFFFFKVLLSAFKGNFSDHNICSLSKLEYAQKPNSCFYHPNTIPYWGLTYLLGFFACVYLIWY